MDKLSKDAIIHLMRTSALLADTVQGVAPPSELIYEAKSVEAAIAAIRNLVPEFSDVDINVAETYVEMQARRAN